MKTLLLSFMLTAGMALTVFAQDVPVAAKDNFKRSYPNAEKVDWDKKEKDGKTMYTAEYMHNGKEHKAVYDANGKLVKHKTTMKQNELPQSVQTSLRNEYKNDKIDDVYMVQKDGKTFYIVKFDGKDDKKAAYSADGKVMKDHKDWD